jgi:hypothetical protein
MREHDNERKISGFRDGKYEDDSLPAIAPCILVELDRRFRCAYCLHHQGDDGGDAHV